MSADRERVVLLELRLEQIRSALDEARVEADRARDRLAESTAREAEHARRFSRLHEELAQARSEIADLHRRVEHSDAVRAELVGHLFEGGPRGDMEELVRLRREVIVARERASASEGSLARLRARVEELRTSREMVLARVAEWTRLVRDEEPEAADLAEFIAELRGEVMQLERRSLSSEAREEALRDRLVRLGVEPSGNPVDDRASMERAGVTPAADGTDAASPLESEETPGADEPQLAHASVAPEPQPAHPAVPVSESPQVRPAPRARAKATEEPAPVTARAKATEEPAPVTARAKATEEPAPVTARAKATEEPAPVTARTQATEPAPAAPSPARASAKRRSQTDLLQSMEGLGRPEPREAHPAPAPPVTAPMDALAEEHSRTDAVFEELAAANGPGVRSQLLLQLGRTGDLGNVDAIIPWTGWSEPAVRAAAYEALGRLLERDPAQLEPHLRAGLADPDARVRRRVVLTAATARKLALRPLLGALKEDPDAQVRRVVREVLRQAPPDPDSDPAQVRTASGGVS